MALDFERLRRLFEAGNESALHAAANACRRPGQEAVAVPCWVLEALVKRQVEHMRRLPGKGKGRHASWAKQQRMDLIHLARYVQFTREYRTAAKRADFAQRFAEKAPTPENRARAKKIRESASKREVAARVARGLQPTPFHDGPVTAGAILKSVDLIEEERARDPEEFRRRFSFHSLGWMLRKK